MTDSHGQTRPAIVLAAAQAESATDGLQRLEQVLRRRLECQDGRPETEIRVTADQWTLRDGDELQVLQAVEGGVGLMSTGIQAQLAFRLPGVDSSQPVRMWIARNRQVSPPKNEFHLDAGPGSGPGRAPATEPEKPPQSFAASIQGLVPNHEDRLARLPVPSAGKNN